MHPSTLPTFEPGLQLSKSFFSEWVQPILFQRFPRVSFSAGLLGDGSDVLGFDTAISMDHDWGPRLQIFLSESDFPIYAERIISDLEQGLPKSFHGYQVTFEDPDRATPAHKSEGCLGSNRHGVEIYTVRSFVRRTLGVDHFEHLSIQDWLSFPEQKLLGLTNGAVFVDENEFLRPLRISVAYYPDDLWLHLISAQWSKIAQEQAFVGRAGDVGDEVGSVLIASRLTEAAMRLCFLVERRFAPYSKWFGSAFSRLSCANRITPHIKDVQSAVDWQSRQERLCKLFEAVGALHQELAIPGAVVSKISNYYERPYLVINADEFVTSIRSKIKSHEVSSLPLFGSVDQISNNPNLLCRIDSCRRLISAIT